MNQSSPTFTSPTSPTKSTHLDVPPLPIPSTPSPYPLPVSSSSAPPLPSTPSPTSSPSTTQQQSRISQKYSTHYLGVSRDTRRFTYNAPLLKTHFFQFPVAYEQHGYLLKEGKVNTDFRKRWFVFEGDELSYYIKRDLRDKKGVIPLLKIKGVEYKSGGVSSSGGGFYKGREYVFEVIVKDRVYHIQAASDFEVKAWCDAILKMKEFWENVTPTYRFDNCIEVDSTFDLGDDVVPQDNVLTVTPSLQQQQQQQQQQQPPPPPQSRITTLPSLPPITKSNNIRPLERASTTHSRFIGLKRGRGGTVNALGLLSLNVDDSNDEEESVDDTIVGVGLLGVSEKIAELDDTKTLKLPKIEESRTEFSNTRIEEIIQEIQGNSYLHDHCVIGSEVVEWLTIRFNWPRQKCVRFGSLLLNKGFVKPFFPQPEGTTTEGEGGEGGNASGGGGGRAMTTQLEDNGTVYRLTHRHSQEQSSKIYNSNTPIRINARGNIFSTLPKTLSRIPGSYFANILSTSPGEDGAYMIDRNPQILEDILDYLRDGSIFIPTNDETQLIMLKREAQFFKLDEIISKCDQVLESL